MRHLTAYKILFAGGCHVTGYPVGAEFGFPKVALDFLENNGIHGDMKSLGPLPISHPERLVDLCNDYKPDVLVLQIGNYETTPGSIRDYLKKVIRWPSFSPPKKGILPAKISYNIASHMKKYHPFKKK